MSRAASRLSCRGADLEPAGAVLPLSMASPLSELLRCQAAEGYRPACFGHLGDAMLPPVPRFAAEMVNRSGWQLGGDPIKPAGSASSESHRRRRPDRNPQDMFEHAAIPMPTDPGARIVLDQQRLNEFVRFEAPRTAPHPRVAEIANLESVPSARSTLSRNRNSSQTRLSVASPAIRGSGRAKVSPRRWTRSEPVPHSA